MKLMVIIGLVMCGLVMEGRITDLEERVKEVEDFSLLVGQHSVQVLDHVENLDGLFQVYMGEM